jgi:uncharacterized tellurite resistance protein B-like protein
MKPLELLKVLYDLTVSDKVIEHKEVSFLTSVAQKIGAGNITIEEIKNLTVDLSPEYPKSEQDRMTVLYYLLFLMKADDKITEKEIKYVHLVGFKLGFNTSMVTDMVDTIKSYRDKDVPPNALVEIIKKHQN